MPLPVLPGSNPIRYEPEPGPFSLLQLPRELILLICNCLSEHDLRSLSQVNSVLKQLSLVVILSRHGVSESQLQSQELSNVSPHGLRAITSGYPAVISNIRALDVRFHPEDTGRVAGCSSLKELAQRFPAIPWVTLTFSEPGWPILSNPLWSPLSKALAALMGNNSRPVVIIRVDTAVVVVRPRPPNILKRAWRMSAGSSPLLAVDKQNLEKKLLHSITGVITRTVKRISSIQVHSFTRPGAALGSFIVLNPDSIFHFTIGSWNDLTLGEWGCAVSDLVLPSLRTLFVGADLEYEPLSVFLDRHKQIEHLEFTSDWSCLHKHDLPPFPTSALPRLKRITAGSRVLTRMLQTPNDFPLLDSVCVVAGDFVASNTDSSRHLEAASRAVAARSSVTKLMIRIQGVEPPWKTSDVDDATTEGTLPYIQELRIFPWTPRTDWRALPGWLTRFPALHTLTFIGNLFPMSNAPLVPKQLVETINVAYPGVIVKQEKRI